LSGRFDANRPIVARSSAHLDGLGIVVMSCDAYSDAWSPFFRLFRKYWPACPCSVYLVAEEKALHDDLVVDVLPGRREWSERLIAALDLMPESRVLLLQEDYLLTKPVLEDKIAEYLACLNQHGAALLKLFPLPAPDQPFAPHSGLGRLSNDFTYRISTQAAIWDKEFLRGVARPNESVWDFEVNGSVRAAASDRLFLSVEVTNRGRLDHGHYPYSYTQSTGIVRGRWAHEMVALDRRESLGLDRRARPFESAPAAWLRKAPIPVRRPIEFVLSRLRRLRA